MSDQTQKMVPLSTALDAVSEMAVDIGNEWKQLEAQLRAENDSLRAALEDILKENDIVDIYTKCHEALER